MSREKRPRTKESNVLEDCTSAVPGRQLGDWVQMGPSTD